MSKAAELAALIGGQKALGNKNFVINGAMQVAQRGTSKSSVTSGEYPSIDRYNMNLSSLGTWTISQSTTTPSGQGFTTSLKLDCTTADASPSASAYFLVEQRIEAQNLQNLCYGTSSAKSLTLSFWVRSNKTGTYYTEIQHGDAGSNYFNNHSYTISSADTWEKKTISITGQTDAVINNDTGTGMFVRWFVAAGSDSTSGTTTNNTWHQTAANRAAGQVNLADSTDNEWYITGIQLEVGDVATAFEHEDIGTTLRKCERYTLLTGNILLPKMREADRYRCGSYQFRTTMRAAPTFPTVTDGASISVSVQDITTRGAVCYAVVPTDGHGSMISDGIVVSAEL